MKGKFWWITGYYLPGTAFDLAAASDGFGFHLWTLGVPATPNVGHAPNVWKSDHFETIGGAGYRVAVDASGTPWIRNGKSRAAFLQSGKWQEVPGDVWDLAIGGNQLWASKTKQLTKNGPIVRWNGSGWDETGCQGFEVSVSSTGEPWFTTTGDSGYRIGRLRGGICQNLPGAAVDIAVYDDDNAWIVGKDNLLYKWNEPAWRWDPIDPYGPKWLVYRIDAGRGFPIIRTLKNEIFVVTKIAQV